MEHAGHAALTAHLGDFSEVNPLSVLLDVTPLGCAPTAKTGLARVAESLAKALSQRSSLSVATCAFGSVVASAEYAAQARPYASLSPIPYAPSALERAYLQVCPSNHRLGQLVNLLRNPLRGCDLNSFQVVHSTYARFPRVVRKLGAARVITIHDVIGLRLPPQMVTRGQAAITRRILRSIGPDDWVVCVSEHTRSDFLRETRHPESRTLTIHNGVDNDRFQPVTAAERVTEVLTRHGVADRPYVLTMSSLAPHKNLALLLRLWPAIHKRHRDAKLLVVGGKSARPDALRESLGADSADTSIIMSGFVSDEEFATLASKCHAFLFPSLYEGFGLPPLEAMACGAPVIASNTSSLPEVIGAAGILIDPTNQDDWTAAVDAALQSPPSPAARQMAIAQAREFAWENAAAEYERVYRSAVGAPLRN